MIPDIYLLIRVGTLSMALAACAAPAQRQATVEIDPSLTAVERSTVVAGLAEWQSATRDAFTVDFAPFAPGTAGPGTIVVVRDDGLTVRHECGHTGAGEGGSTVVRLNAAPQCAGYLARSVRHELGHAFGLRFPRCADPLHYCGPCPSAMKVDVADDSDAVEAVDVSAFESANP